MRLGRLYPFVLAAVPVLHVLADNPGVSSPWDQLLILAVTLGITALVYLAARVALRRRDGERLSPLVTALVMAWLLGYRSAAEAVEPLGVSRPHLVLVPLLGAATVAAVIWAHRRPPALDQAGRFLTLTGALVLAFSAIDIANDYRRAARLLRDSSLLRQLGRPIPAPATPPQPTRDIYVIILDEYSNSQVLRERFGYDNRPFEDRLRALGFHVPALVQSNYAHTLLSIPSLLNAAHLTALEEEVGRRGSDPTLPNALVGRSRIAAFLKSRGYRYVFFPSQWWYATRHSPQADVEPRIWHGFEPRRELGRTALRRAMLEFSSVPGRLWESYFWDADHVRRTLREVAKARRFGEPIFVFAHVISPHPPYSSDRLCRLRRRQGSYVEQVECLNRQVLALVTDLIRSSPVPPVIVLQGDHGTKSLGFHRSASVDQVPLPAARERFGTFGAYYLPRGGKAGFGDTITVVNVLGNVLRYYFGAELRREPDVHHLSVDAAPFDFRQIDPDSLRAGAAPDGPL
jgi:hypothetical protein